MQDRRGAMPGDGQLPINEKTVQVVPKGTLRTYRDPALGKTV
jgi:hypothetical protein